MEQEVQCQNMYVVIVISNFSHQMSITEFYYLTQMNETFLELISSI